MAFIEADGFLGRLHQATQAVNLSAELVLPFAGFFELLLHSAAVRFVEAKLPVVSPVSGVTLEVRLPDGTVLRGTNATELAALVRALKA